MERLERKKTTYTRKKRGGGGYRYGQTTRDHHHDRWTVDIHPLSPPQAYKYGSWACGMYPDLSYSEATAATETLVLGVAPQKTDPSPRWVQRMAASVVLTASAILAIANEGPEFEAKVEKNLPFLGRERKRGKSKREGRGNLKRKQIKTKEFEAGKEQD
ncbi:Metallothionein [Forsythia ovata]|uniref:Metallothionein-like protein n=1 Tax=Forsythia ovata TaxID=205694 RepID=A0ABD1T9W1_9LAMI